ncbi:hypothetical protein Vi05172_g12631 [Venturia inaequalis]|nr:hypothetical protein Vi05172_g12631 [Venturia inaequalis]
MLMQEKMTLKSEEESDPYPTFARIFTAFGMLVVPPRRQRHVHLQLLQGPILMLLKSSFSSDAHGFRLEEKLTEALS